MHTTVDEREAAADPRVTEHARRSAFYAAVHGAHELDGLPVPKNVSFPSSRFVELRMDENQPGEVDSWAAHLGLTFHTTNHVFAFADGRLWRSYRAEHDGRDRWHDYQVDVWAIVYLTADEVAAYRAQQAAGS